jgi:coproporphyrinogen III oxidase-like Fe-S oxidoreductase
MMSQPSYVTPTTATTLRTNNRIFYALSYQVGETLFKIIASNGGFEKDYLTAQFEHLTKKQFYVNINRLKAAGLIRLVKRRYILTPFGRVVYQVLQAIEQVASQKTRFEILEIAQQNCEIPREEWEKIAKLLITNDQVRGLAFDY